MCTEYEAVLDDLNTELADVFDFELLGNQGRADVAGEDDSDEQDNANAAESTSNAVASREKSGVTEDGVN